MRFLLESKALLLWQLQRKKKGDQDGHTHFRYAVTCSGQWEISLIVACSDSRLLVRQAFYAKADFATSIPEYRLLNEKETCITL